MASESYLALRDRVLELRGGPALMNALFSPDSFRVDNRVKDQKLVTSLLADQAVTRIRALQEFSGLVEVDIIVLHSDEEITRAISDGCFDSWESA